MSENIAITIDLSGMPCPAPLLGAKKIIDDLSPGQTMCLLSDCPGTSDDLFAWCRYTGNEVVSSERRKDGKVAYLLRKAGGAATIPIAHVTLDMRGVTCPGPILEAKKLLGGMKPGEVLHLVADCTAAVDDIRSWSSASAIELLASLPMARGAQEFYLRKG
ncbi:MAG: sulfurtransferase TusA family protein [Candidatus Nitricoxidivorans perseverans]|uniref:Sulfurtransferase TusA family protein n=1 Tax=Candidatus Nitricoxidivorans perseverans TaxID=2975601 RepID=A0AA49IYX3_9PROT|nr:MAG: sulfurtransferase TusA family protein [Candidatus Nitricoxidivorans perseverans]